MVRHAPIHRRSDHSDIAICCGRNVRGSSLSTSVVPLSNQVTTLNHKRFKGFKMFSDGHLDREARCDCMLITGRWFSDWARQNGKAHLLTGLRTVWLDELLLYRRIRELGALPTGLDQTAHQADDTEQPE